MDALLAWAAATVGKVNAPRIERSDEGFTINKTLAWTILVAIIGGSIWVGRTVSEVRGEIAQRRQEIAQIREDKAELAASLAALEARVRPLENAAPAINARLDYIAEAIRRIERAVAPEAPDNRL
jgi:septal ring factor EnvC (AmiA/AmiB activator)